MNKITAANFFFLFFFFFLGGGGVAVRLSLAKFDH